MSVEFQTRVKGGFPVLVRAMFYDGDVDDLEVLTLRGKPAPWLSLSKADLSKLEEEAHEAASAQRRSAEEDAEEAKASYWEGRYDYLRCEGRA